MYLRWRMLLPRWIRLIPIELPGRGLRSDEPFSTSFDALVEQLCLEQERMLQSPYALFGHSMGALLVYGIAARLQQQRKRLPMIMYASACPAPVHFEGRGYDARLSEQRLIADLRRYGGTPAEVFDTPEMLQLALAALAADYGICDSFRYREAARLPVPLRVLGGRDDEVLPEHLDAWRQETTASFALHWFNGGHFYIQPHEVAVIRHIEQCLSSIRKTLKEFTEAAPPALSA
jgi:surfactin synthase thioesterase subunit